jgi:hypothetical protein
MKTKRRYTGKLAKPIYVGTIPIEGTIEELPEWIEREIVEKLPILMEHYGIADKDDFFSLALALAMDYVPGFQVNQVALKLKHGTWELLSEPTSAALPNGRRSDSLISRVPSKKQNEGAAFQATVRPLGSSCGRNGGRPQTTEAMRSNGSKHWKVASRMQSALSAKNEAKAQPSTLPPRPFYATSKRLRVRLPPLMPRCRWN